MTPLTEGGNLLTGLPTWAEVILGLFGALGVAKLLQSITDAYLRRRVSVQERVDKETDRSRTTTRQVAEVAAKANETMLERLTAQVDARLEDYRTQIAAMREEHTAEIGQLRKENRELERRVEDLRRTVSDYQNGLQVPRGMVLIPLDDVRQMRGNNPGVLPRRWYVGEDEMPPSKTNPLRE